MGQLEITFRIGLAHHLLARTAPFAPIIVRFPDRVDRCIRCCRFLPPNLPPRRLDTTCQQVQWRYYDSYPVGRVVKGKAARRYDKFPRRAIRLVRGIHLPPAGVGGNSKTYKRDSELFFDVVTRCWLTLHGSLIAEEALGSPATGKELPAGGCS